MRHLLASVLLAATLAGCAHGAPTASAVAASALAVRDASPLDLQTALTRFTKSEGRKVSAAQVPMNNGHGGATLTVPLSLTEQQELVQLYRLNPRPSDVATWPKGLMDRAADEIAVLHHFGLPADAAFDAAAAKAQIKPRQYMDGQGKVWAYEAFYNGGSYRLAGKYDLKGRMLQVDMDVWQTNP